MSSGNVHISNRKTKRKTCYYDRKTREPYYVKLDKNNLLEKELSDKTNEKPVLQVNKSLGLRSQRR